jgi:hypothetical protein
MSNLEHLKAVAESSRKSGEPVVVVVDLSFDPQTNRPNLRGARLETTLDVAMAIPGWFVAIRPAGLRVPEPTPQREAISRHDAHHRLLLLTENEQEEPLEFFPVDRSFLAAVMCMRGVDFRRVTEEEYQNLLNTESAPTKTMAAA